MPQPANVMTTSAPSDDYENLDRSALQDLAKERGIPANMKSEEIVAALRDEDRANEPAPEGVEVAPGADLGATEDFVAPGQPAHRYDANKRPPDPSDPSITFVSRDHLLRMARGEIVDIAGKRVAAGENFPPYHQLQR